MALVSKSKSVSFVGPFPLHPLQSHVLYSRFKEVQLSLALLPKLVALKDIYDIDKAVGSITQLNNLNLILVTKDRAKLRSQPQGCGGTNVSERLVTQPHSSMPSHRMALTVP